VQIENAKPRYTPEADVDVPIAKAFEALGRTDWFHNEFQQSLSDLQEKEGDALSDGRPKLLNDLNSSVYQNLIESLENIPQLASNINKIHESFPLEEIISETNTAVSAASSLQDEIREEQDDDSQDKELKTANRQLRELWSELRNFRSVLQQDSTSLINNSVLCVTGRAGVGKTHLFCDIAENRLSDGKPTVLVLANSYQGGNPWKFVIEETELECGIDEFLEALDAFGEARDVRSLILIDGLNESRAMDQWTDYLSGMIQKLSVASTLNL
jgi:signal recognition particle GTPase